MQARMHGSTDPAPAPKPKRQPRSRLFVPDAFEPPATWVIGLYTCSEANVRVHWADRDRRRRTQQAIVGVAFHNHLDALSPFVDALRNGQQVRVTMTRIGPGILDGDNRDNSLKAVRDAVSALLEIDDGSPLFDWRYGSEKNKAYGIRIHLEILQHEP